MQPLYTKAEFKAAKSIELLPLKCLHCVKTFYISKRRIQSQATQTNFKANFCSQKCNSLYHKPPVIVICEQCNKSFSKSPSQIRKTKHNFCSRSCAGVYDNAHKTTGTCVSKLERWLQSRLPFIYPSLEFHFNLTDAINGELDIYIPSLKLAFELNGIFHYEPIYGPEKLAKMKTNDARKSQACLERGIELCIIDVSHQKYFKEQSSMRFLSIIQNVIDSKLANLGQTL